MNYTIANIRVSLPDACTGAHFTRALQPFRTAEPGPADLTLEIVSRLPDMPGYRELYRFDFTDADADCRFGRDEAGYLLEIAPRDGSAPARFRTGPTARLRPRAISPRNTIPRCCASDCGRFTTSPPSVAEPWLSIPR